MHYKPNSDFSAGLNMQIKKKLVQRYKTIKLLSIDLQCISTKNLKDYQTYKSKLQLICSQKYPYESSVHWYKLLYVCC